MRRKHVGEGLGCQADLSTEKCTVALLIGKGDIMMELNNCWGKQIFLLPPGN